jgi:hypothetical protein
MADKSAVGVIMQINFFIGISGTLPRADKSAPTDVPIILFMCIIGPYGCPDSFVKERH